MVRHSVARTRSADIEVAGRCARSRTQAAACAAIRWCRRYWNASPVRKLSRCGRATPSHRRPTARYRPMTTRATAKGNSERQDMADFMGMMKKAAELQSKMQAMQAELESIEVEGVFRRRRRQGRAERQGRPERRHASITFADESGREGNPRGPSGHSPCRCAQEVRRRDGRKDESTDRRSAAAARIELPFG